MKNALLLTNLWILCSSFNNPSNTYYPSIKSTVELNNGSNEGEKGEYKKPASLVSSNFVSLIVPITYEGIFPYIKDDGTLEEDLINTLPHNSTLLKSLPNASSSVTVIELSNEIGGSYTFLSASNKNQSYTVIYDHIIYTTLSVNDDKGKPKYHALVGLTVRMLAKIKTKESKINITDLFQLGFSASKKKVEGSLEVHSIGCNSEKIQGFIPVTSDLSPASIQSALQSVATIKTRIFDDATAITPQVLALSYVGSETQNQIDLQDFLVCMKRKTDTEVKAFKK